ncbi:GNAT family N-acetyltransferase [Streptomyces hoynatensis]|uniref:GNAT family N-acetyltransferase n=1 Tax=Streptomyces hoynatensis TaxID=1141874 RepID=A0A3A9YPA9_9ACTN|nr:GNAT family N-acetyltransferase [Streptomyces hoynatensis]RKN36986.1 GNAT family N-acetyltransferase [Streptomyces hoynatensis]
MHHRHATPADAPALAALYAAQHRDNLSEEERRAHGFVQGDFRLGTLRALAERRQILVAEDEAGGIAGLVGLMPPHALPEPPPPVAELLRRQDSLRWHGRPLSRLRWVLYGPVVVGAAHRRRGVARGLFTTAMRAAAPDAELVVAFIESGNESSWRVHVERFGMSPIGRFGLGGRTYHVVAAPPPARDPAA